MSSFYWIKLYHDLLNDYKVAGLPDRVWRRMIECFLLAGEKNENGWLPRLEEIAWRLRADAGELEEDLHQLAGVGVLECREQGWFVTNFAERQSAMSDAERVRRHRDRKRKKQRSNKRRTAAKQNGNGAVTFRYTDKDKDIDIETDKIRACVGKFCEKAKIPEPTLDFEDAAVLDSWVYPSCYMLRLVDYEKEPAVELVSNTIDYMDIQGLSFKNMASLTNVARTVLSMNGHNQDRLWSSVIDWVKGRREFGDFEKPVQQAIKVVGESNLRGQYPQQHKQQFFSAYSEASKK